MLSGDLEDAKATFQKTLEARRKCLGFFHVGTAEAHEGIALLLAADGNAKGALKHYEDALQIYERVSWVNEIGRDWDRRKRVGCTSHPACTHPPGRLTAPCT